MWHDRVQTKSRVSSLASPRNRPHPQMTTSTKIRLKVCVIFLVWEHSSIKQPLNHLTEKAINEQKHRNSLLSNSNENIKIKQNKELSKE